MSEVRYLRQALVIPKSLSMPAGKIGAMVAHAAMTFLCKRLKGHYQWDENGNMAATALFTANEWQWLTELEPGLEQFEQLSFAKIVLAVPDVPALLEVEKKAKEHKLQVYRVVDGGHSHNKPGDVAAIAIGPAWPEELAPVTGDLRPYR